MTQEIQKFVVNGDVVEIIQWDGSIESADYIEKWSNKRTACFADSTTLKAAINVPVNGEFEKAEPKDYIMKRVKDSSMFFTDSNSFERFKETFDVAE